MAYLWRFFFKRFYELMIKVLKYIDKIDFKSTSEYLQNYFLIRGRSWIEAAPNWPENIFWLEAAAINGAATVPRRSKRYGGPCSRYMRLSIRWSHNCPSPPGNAIPEPVRNVFNFQWLDFLERALLGLFFSHILSTGCSNIKWEKWFWNYGMKIWSNI